MLCCVNLWPGYKAVSSANLLRRVHPIPSSRSLIKILNRTGPQTEPWGTPLVSGCQRDVTPATLRKSRVAVLLNTLLTSPRTDNSIDNFMVAVPKTASNHQITLQSFSVGKQQVQQNAFPRSLAHQLCQEVLFPTLQEHPRRSFALSACDCRQATQRNAKGARVRAGDVARAWFTPALPACEVARLPWCWPWCL